MKYLAALILLALISTAEARPAVVCNGSDIMQPCREMPSNNFLAGIRSISVRMHRVHSIDVVPNPAGCPSRAFCGCGAAVRVFGAPIRDLWLAANWFRFPRTTPAPGMVAVRRHHVFVLEQHLEGSTWIAYDANSGGHATRIHARSIAGYTIVNPRA
jgi:hypothetical protein